MTCFVVFQKLLPVMRLRFMSGSQALKCISLYPMASVKYFCYQNLPFANGSNSNLEDSNNWNFKFFKINKSIPVALTF